MQFTQNNQIIKKYNNMILRDRVLILLTLISLVLFIWYEFFGKIVLVDIFYQKKNKENILSESNKILFMNKKNLLNENIIKKRINSIKNKISIIENDTNILNNTIININDIVFTLVNLLDENNKLYLENLNVYPKKIINLKNNKFEKNVIVLILRGDYSSIFFYLKKIENIKWKIFFEYVKYVVDKHPTALVEIKLYTLSVIEND